MRGLIICFVIISVRSLGQDYAQYHARINEAEEFIVHNQYKGALKIYEEVFTAYDFVFLNDYQIATQIALAAKEEEKCWKYLIAGIKSGWTLKSIKHNSYLEKLKIDPQWKLIKKEYGMWRNEYEIHLNQDARKKVKKMFSKDQWRAIGALFTFGSKGQDRYAEKKFAPNSEKQIDKLITILNDWGYPGERLIGNNFWMATILSHHNSISQAYVQQDTLYQFVKPSLLNALATGQMSPWEFAMLDGWYRTVKAGWEKADYGFLNPPTKEEWMTVNELRKSIGLRSIETRNRLIDIEQSTGMNFYLGGRPWVEGKIEIKGNK